ncbi:unnamed protein product, partial [Dicrocoelium dendriticum]
MEPGDVPDEQLKGPFNGDYDEVLAGSLEQPASSFNEAIGHLEDIMISDEFQTLQENFINEHCYCFSDSSENKLCYTDIHMKYVDIVERFL